MSAPLPDYYSLLGVSPSSTPEEIRAAYKRASLQCHPDRFPNAAAAEKQRLTRKFQSLADAYYVLSNTDRRRDYDAARVSRGTTAFDEGEEEQEQSSSANFFSSFFQSAAGAGAGAGASAGGEKKGGHGASAGDAAGSQPQASGVFNDVFEEMLRPEVHRVVPLWKWVGTASGAGLGFIVANIPGALGGAALGNRLGAIRDAKGKSVGAVFMNLNQGQRAEVLVSHVAELPWSLSLSLFS